MTTKRMWDGGPLRQWSDKQTSACDQLHQNGRTRGYAGSYVCEGCKVGVGGVYRVYPPYRWVCAACKEAMPTPKSTLK